MTRIRAIQTSYGGRKYRSRVEARWSIFFDCCGIPFEYEHQGYELPSSGPYLPDFWLPTFRLFVEIKGEDPTDEERQKCVELAATLDRPVLLAVGAPDERFQITWFDAAGEDDGILYAIARDRNSDAGFWLVAEDTYRWLGGGGLVARETPRYGPMFSGALEEAYAAALSERFDRGAPRRRRERIAEPDAYRLLEGSPTPSETVRAA